MTTEVSPKPDFVQRRLERENEAVLRLLKKTKSYRFEPKDYSCFQLLQQLRSDLGELLGEQEMAIKKFSSKTALGESLIEDIETLSLRFKQLEKKMAEYLLRVTS